MSCLRHYPKHTRDRPFFGPVSRDENRAAHGCVTRVENCECGATRQVNVNGWHEETGPWVEPTANECADPGADGLACEAGEDGHCYFCGRFVKRQAIAWPGVGDPYLQLDFDGGSRT